MLRCGVIVLALILILVLAVRPRQLAQRGYRTPSTMAALSLIISHENVATSEATSGAAKVWPEKISVSRFAKGERPILPNGPDRRDPASGKTVAFAHFMCYQA
jgi:hypothetical protein